MIKAQPLAISRSANKGRSIGQSKGCLAISSLYNTLTSKLLKTFTMDRGKEFAYYEQVETEFGIPLYFADAYAA